MIACLFSIVVFFIPKNKVLLPKKTFSVFCILQLLIINCAFSQVSDVIIYDKAHKSVVNTINAANNTVVYKGNFQGVSVLDFTGEYQDENFAGEKAVLQEFYNNEGDNYDFVFIFTEFEFDTGEAAAFAITLENGVEGIGLDIRDFSTDFHSEKLQSIINMASLDRWKFNPSDPKYDDLLGTMMHEVMHRWGIRVKYIDAQNQVSNRLLGRADVHWNYFLNSNASVMYGSLWEETQANQFKTTDVRHGLSPLDLYLAGFASKDSVADIFVINNGSAGVRIDIPPLIGTEITGDKEVISIDDIIAYEGEREPDYNNSQHQFDIKFILLKAADDELNPKSIANLFVLQKEFQKRFFAETHGVGRVILPTDQDNSVINNPATLTYDLALNNSFDLQSAVDFLLTDVGVDWWFDRDASKVRDTVTVIKALQLIIDDYPEAQSKLSAAIAWVNAYQAQNNDEIAWMLSSGILSNDKKQALLDDVMINEKSAGGWGLNSKINPSPYDTALTIDALNQALAGDFDLSLSSTQFVLNNINQSSGFSYVSGGSTSLVASSILLKTIDKISTDPQHLSDLADYLLSQKLPDNSYGDGGEVGMGTPHETALVILALESINDSSYQTQVDLARSVLNKMQSIDGSMQGSIYSTALAISLFNSNTKANLAFNSVTVSNDVVVAGEQIFINYSLINSGVIDAENIEVNVYENVVDSNSLVGQSLINSLTSTQSAENRVLIDTTGFNNNTDLIIVVDVNNNIAENNENDNAFTLPIIVHQPSDVPELAFDVGAFIITPSQFDTLPFTVAANATVSNLSLLDIDNVIVSLSMIEVNGEHTLLQTETLDIPSLASKGYSFSLDITQANVDVEILLEIDREQVITEVNENNNSYVAIISKVQSVDLVLAAEDIIIPAQVIVGETQDISFDFSNSGTELTSSFNIRVYAEINANSQLIFESLISEASAGEQLNRLFSWEPLAQGDYNIRFILDEDNQLAETNETNNEIIMPVQVVANVLSNIAIDFADVSMSPNPGLQGQDLQFNLDVHNNSDSDSGVFDITVYQQSPNGIPNIVIASLLNVASIAANTSNIVQLDLLATTLQDDHTYIFEIDSGNSILEFNENDNIVFKDFKVLSKADAQVSAGSFQLTPSIPVLGSTISVEVNIGNLGEQNLNLLDVSLYYDNSLSSNPVLIETQNISILAGGQNQVSTFVFTYPDDVNVDSLIIKVDEANSIAESNEANNQARIVVGNQDQSLYVSQRYFSPNGDGIKDQTSIIFNTEVTANYRIEVVDSTLKTVKHFDAELFNDTAFGDVIWDGLNDRGVLARDGDYFIQLYADETEIIATALVTLDTNNSSLFKSFVENNGYTSDLNCLGNFQSSHLEFSHDGENLYTDRYTTKFGIAKSGLFRVKADGSKLTSMVPQSYLNRFSGFSYTVLESGDILLHSVNNDSSQEINLINSENGSIKRIDFVATQFHFSQPQVYVWTDEFLIVSNNSDGFAKVYYDTSINREIVEFDVNNFYRATFLAELQNGFLVILDQSREIFFQNYDFTIAPVMIENVIDPFAIYSLRDNVKQVSNDKRSFVYRKNDTVLVYRVENDGLVLAFSIADIHNDNFGFNSHNELVLLDDDGNFQVYNANGLPVIAPESTYLIENFDPYIVDVDTVTIGHYEIGFETLAISDMLSSELSQSIIGYTDSTDKKEMVFLIKNTLLGTFNISLPGFGDIETVPIVSVLTQVKVNYDDIVDIGIEVITLEIFIEEADDGYGGGEGKATVVTEGLTFYRFSDMQEGRGSVVRLKLGRRDSYWIDRDDFTAEVQSANDGLFYSSTESTFPRVSLSPQLFLNRIVNKQNRVEIIDSVLIDNQTLTIENGCDTSSRSKYVYRSKDNLYADISLSNQQNGIAISATAFDKDLDRVEVHFSSVSTPGQWNLLYSSNQPPITGDNLLTWIASESGIYNIKLTAYDKAGNSKIDVEQKSVNSSVTTIRNIDVSPKFFSPNGDGIKDTIDIQYEVVTSADVLIEVEDEFGLIVRTYEREYINPVLSDLIQWDGKNQSGVLLPDGKYQVIVQGFRFEVYLDTLPIFAGNYHMSLEFSESINEDFKLLSYETFPSSSLELVLNDLLDYHSYDVQKFNASSGLWQTVFFDLHSNDLPADIASNYRLRIEDKAANISFTEIPFEVNKYRTTHVLKKVDDEVYDFRFEYEQITDNAAIDETFPDTNTAPNIVNWQIGDKLAYALQVLSYEDIESINFTVEYTDQNNGALITQSKLVNSLAPSLAMDYIENDFAGSNTNGNNIFNIDFGSADVPMLIIELDETDFPVTDEIIDVIFEIKLISQEIITTRSKIQFPPITGGFNFNLKKIAFDSTKDLKDITDGEVAYDNAINAILQDSDLEYFWIFSNSDEMKNLSDFLLIINDVEINAQNIYSPHFIDITENYFSMLFVAPKSRCQSTIKTILSAVDINGDGFESDEFTFENKFCLEPKLEGQFFIGQFCDRTTQNNTSMRLNILAEEIDPQSNLPFLIELYRIIANGEDEIIFADTSPEFTQGGGGLRYFSSVDYDMSQIPGGSHKFKVIMTDIEGNIEAVTESFQVDSHIANNQINSPLEGVLFCSTDERTGSVIVTLNANVGATSLYGAQINVVSNGAANDVNEEGIVYDGYNNYGKIAENESIITLTKEILAPFYSGPTSLVFESYNSSGVSFCSEVEVVIDALVDFSIIETDSSAVEVSLSQYFSPNADGIKDSIRIIGIDAHEELTVELELYNSDDIHHVLGIISNTSLVTNEEDELIWDGRLNGSVVADGKYLIKVKVIDNCGLTNIIEVTAIVDTTDPLSTFLSPVDGGFLDAIQRVEINIEEENLVNNAVSLLSKLADSVKVEFNYNNVWNEITIIAASSSAEPRQYLIELDWNLTSLSAAVYPLRVTVEDLAGNSSFTIINPELVVVQDVFWNYRIFPLFISPNADNVQDNAIVEFGLNVDSVVSIDVLDNNQNTIRSLLANQLFIAQAHQITFNGLDNNSIPLADGVYTVMITASEAANLSNSTILESVITIDNLAPQIQWLAPLSAIIKDEGIAQVMLQEQYVESIEVTNQQLSPLTPEVALLSRTEAGTFDLFDLSSLNEAEYQLKAEAIDLAGNTTIANITYTIDKTAPQIELTTPVNDAYVGGTEAIVAVSGNITELHFEHYELSIAAVSENPVWQDIHTETELIESEFDYQWLTAINDGQYLLRVRAYDQAGWVTETSIEIILDRTVPLAQITQPLNNATVGMGTDILGVATDINFDFYTLSYKESIADAWELFNISQQPVSSQLLGQLTTELVNGNYDIKLIVQDKVGLTSEYQVNVNLDIEPPPVPLNLTLEKLSNQQVSLNWSVVSASDLAGYLVYRNGEQITPQVIADNHYLDASLSDGEYVFTVTSVDSFGNISEHSNHVTTVIDTTPPDVVLISPANEQRVNGTINIIGTALSLLDFKDYRLYYRESSQASPGTLIHQSPIPVTLDLLGVLDTTGLNQNQQYTLRLEATDTFENTAVIEQNIFVDNIAPSAPLNLSLQLQTQNSVRLSWVANNESDLAGYLVFRNGIVISGSGDGNATVANALSQTSFIADNLIDGTHVFTIAAIDFTGNISQFSNTVEETINTRPPDTIIITPVASQRFELPILFEATSPDDDIAQIKFEYSVDNSNWIELDIDQQPPFQTTINPAALSLSFGNVFLRAVATDTTAQVDSSPARVTVEYVDLTAPSAVQNIVADINGGIITLNWDINNEIDVQGYLVYREIDGVLVQLTNTPITNPLFVDNGLPDSTYVYQISAIDNANNESAATQIDGLTVFSIILEQVFSPMLTPKDLQFNGQSPQVTGVIKSTLVNDNGSFVLGDITPFASGSFSSQSRALVIGNNAITASHQLSASHISKVATLQVQLSPIPQKPVNFQVNVQNLTSTLSWEAPDDTFAYLAYRNGTAINPVDQLGAGINYQASSNQSQAFRVGDADEASYWSPSFSNLTNGSEIFLELSLSQPRWITSSDIRWTIVPENYTLQYFAFTAINNKAVTKIVKDPKSIKAGETVLTNGAVKTNLSGVSNSEQHFTMEVPANATNLSFNMAGGSGDADLYVRYGSAPTTADFDCRPFFGGNNEDCPIANIQAGTYYIMIRGFSDFSGVSLTGSYSVTVANASNIGWVNVAKFDSNNQSHELVTTDVPYLTNRVRILIDNPVGNLNAGRLSELAIYHRQLDGQLTLDVDEQNGVYSYQVSAINNYGFESELTESIEVLVGDIIAPDGVILTGNISGTNDASLNWSASVSVDVSNYWLFRNDELVFITNDETMLSFTDIGLLNGNYDYYVKAVDAAGNVSPSSNVINIDIQQQALAIPENVSIFAILVGNATQLEWDPVQENRLHHYNVYRSLISGGSYSHIAETIDTNYLDDDLENGITYYYTVTTVDQFGNESDLSDEVSTTPVDSVPATTPVITSPTIFGQPLILSNPSANIAGVSDPGVLIDLYINNAYTRTVSTARDYIAESQNLSNVRIMHLSKQGDWYSYTNGNNELLVNNIINGAESSIDLDVDDFIWNDSGTLIYVITRDFVNGGRKLVSYDLNLQEKTTFFTVNNVSSAVPSPDESLIFYRGSFTDPQSGILNQGLWLFDVTSATTTEIPIGGNLALNNNRIAWSDDGQNITFTDRDAGGSLYLYNISNQMLTLIDTGFNSNNSIDWSPDNKTFIYDKSTSDQLFSYDVVTTQITQLPLVDGSIKSARFSVDGSQIVYRNGFSDIYIYDFISQTSFLISSQSGVNDIMWNVDNGIELAGNGKFTKISIPGSFSFSGVLLNLGLNQLHVVARDGSGIASEASLPILLEVEASGLPDLVINSQGFAISPESALQASPFVASVEISNTGSQVVIDAEVQVFLTLPGGSIQNITGQNSVSLLAGETQPLFIDIGVLNTVGDYTLQVIVDPQNLISEVNENNNNANKTLVVLEDLDPILQMLVTPEQAAPEQMVTVAMNVFNPVQVFNGHVVLTISDENNFPIGNEIQLPIIDLLENTTAALNYDWDTTDVFSGVYQLDAQLITSNGQLLNQQSKQIEIISFAEFDISLDIGNNVITENENILFTTNISYSRGNTPQNGSLTWEVLNDLQQVIWSDETNLPVMLKGFTTTLSNQWQTQTIGDYQLRAQFNADNYQQTLLVPFTVIAAADIINLQGQIGSDPVSVILGNNLTVEYNLINTGDIELNNIPITIKLLSVDLTSIIANTTTDLSLLVDEEINSDTIFPSLNLTTENYLLALYADMSAYGESANQLIDTRSIAAVDTTGPKITIASPLVDSLNSANVDVRFSVSDLDGLVENIFLQSADINQGIQFAFNINDLNNFYQYQIFDLSDGLHQIAISATDNFGNYSEKIVAFNVDASAPIIDLSGVSDNTYYNHSVTSVVNITDNNLSSSRILLNGNNIPSSYDITAEGSYFLSIRAEDAIGNISSKNINFFIDLSAPEVVVTFPENNAQTTQSNTLVTGVTEAFSTVALLIGAYQDNTQADVNGDFIFIDVPLQLGANSIELQAIDRASNQSSVKLVIVNVIESSDVDVNMFLPPESPIEEDLQVAYELVNIGVVDRIGLPIRIQLFRENTSTLIETKSLTVDLLASQTFESDVVFNTAQLLPDKYRIIFSVFIDNQWQIKYGKQFVLNDTSAPQIMVTLPVESQVTNTLFTTSIEVTDRYSLISEVVYTIDNSAIWQAMVHSTADTYIANIQLTHGSHSIKYRVADTENNSHESTGIQFDIDTTAPEITVNNPGNGLITNQLVQLDFDIVDDHQYQSIAELNGTSVSVGDNISLAGDYTLIITATDEVNNESQKTVQFIIDTTAPTITVTNLVENQQFILNDINITGLSEAHANITLDIAGVQLSTSSNAQGEFEFTQVHLIEGNNELIFNATDLASNQGSPVSINVFFSDVDDCNIFGFKSAASYNTLIFEDYQAQASHVQGRLAVGNDILIDDYTIAQELQAETAGDALIAGGEIRFASGRVYFGNILAAGAIRVGQSVIDNMAEGAQIIENAQLPIDFSQSYQQLKLFSNGLFELPENSTFSITNDNLNLQGDCQAEIQVYNIDVSEIEQVKSISYDCLLENSYILLNIAGENIHLSYLDLTALDTIQSRLIWNFNQAQNIALHNIDIPGSVLAVDAHIDSSNTTNIDVIFSSGFDPENPGDINGQLIAQSLDSNIRINQQPLLCNNTFEINATPIAVNETISTRINTSIGFVLTVMDENQSNLQYQQISQVSFGQLVGTMPNMTYIPAKDFVGTDSFNYQVTDQHGKSSNATISITVSSRIILTSAVTGLNSGE